MRDIARKTAWAYAGVNYDTELEAIDANLKAIGQRLVRLHANNPLEGLISYGDEIAPLLIRRAELNVADAPLPDRLEGTRDGEPEGTQADAKSTAYEEGKKARQEGKTIHSKHHYTGFSAQEWEDGWTDENDSINSYSGGSIYPNPDPLNDD